MKRFLTLLLLFIPAFTLFATDYYKVKADVLNVRSQPSKSGSIVGVVKKGNIVTAESEVYNGWINISTSAITGYVSADYLEFSHSEKKHSEEKIQRSALEDALMKIPDKIESIVVPYVEERTMTFIIVLLLMFLYGAVKSEIREKTWILILSLVILSAAELYYLFMEDVDPTWFCERFEVGWFGCIIGFIAFAIFLYGQFITILETLGSLNMSTGVQIHWLWGIIAWGIGIILAFILAIFDAGDDGFIVLGTIFFVYQLLFCLYVFSMNILKKQILNGFLHPLLYLFIMIPFSALLTLFLALVIIAALIFMVGGALLGGSSSSSGSRNRNVTLENGTELYETGIDTYRDHNGNYWSRNGNRFTREDN